MVEAREALKETLAEDLGGAARRYSVERLLRQVADASAMSDADLADLPPRATRPVEIFLAERARLERVDAWNRRHASKG